MDVKNSLQITRTSFVAYDDDGHAKRTGKLLYNIITNAFSHT